MKLFRQAYERDDGLPVGYTEVEYLESTGTQYIDTGYIPTPTTTYKSAFQLTNIATTSGAWFCVFGSVESSNAAFTELFLPRASGDGNVNQLLAANHNSNNSTYLRKDYAWAINTLYDFEMTMTNVSINGISQGTISGDTSITCSHSIYLFARHEYNDAVRYNVSAKIHLFKILEGNALVHDFIPCLDPLNVPCMYDLVGKKPYYNKGTGEFTVGHQIHPVQYLESDGTSYIDTGIAPQNNTSIEYTFNAVESSASKFYAGCYGSSTTQGKMYLWSAGGSRYWQYGFGTGASQSGVNYKNYSVASDTEKHTVIMDRTSLTMDGTVVISGLSGGMDGNTLTFWIGKCNDTEDRDTNPTRSYNCKIYNDLTLIRDLIPCKDENNIGFMFDKVTHTTYLNAGTGNFTYGEDATKYKTRLCFVRPTGGSFHMLPKGFTEVEYLSSTGTQYIDTGVIGNGEFNVKYGVYANSLGSGSDIFAGTRSAAQHLNFGQAATNGQFTIGYLNQYWAELSNFAINTRYDIEINYKNGEQYIIINGAKGSSKTYTGTEQTGLSIYLFKRHHYGTDNVGGLQGRIYYFTIKQNDVLVRDYIPCLDSSGRPCMYDRVEGKAYYNIGTGEFSYGHTITPVEYLQSSGTQYIDTGYIPSNTTGQYAKMQYTTINNGVTFGSMVSGNGTVGPYYATSSGSYWWTRWGTNEQKIEASSPTTSDIYELYLNFNNDRVAKANDIIISDSLGNISGNYPSLTLFRRNFSAGYAYLSGKIYKYQITEGTDLVRDFIPVIDENNTPYMFDRVTHTLFANAGTGEFLYGDKKQNYYLAVPKAGELLPAAYRRLEYIEGTGTQYIDTTAKVDANTKLILDYQMTDITTTTNGIFGASGGQTLQFLTQTGQAKYVFQWTPNSTLGVGTKDTDKHCVIFDIPNTNISVDDDTASMASWTFDYPTGNIMLFANGHLSVHGRMKAYGSKIYSGNTLVRHLIPALRKSDDKPGMYDAINKVFYTNAATGADFSYA